MVDFLLSKGNDIEVHLFTSAVARPLYEAQIPAGRLFDFPTRDFNQAWRHPVFLWKLAAIVRRIRPDMCLLSEDQGNVAHFLSSISGAKWRVGSLRSFLKWKWGVNINVEKNGDCSHALWAWEILKAAAREIEISVPEIPQAPDLSRLIHSAERYDFLIHPGGSLPYKRWFPERFSELAERLSSQFRVGWIATGADEELVPARNVVVLDTPHLSDLISLIAAAKVFVGNNSGPMHIAQALGTTAVIFCGPSPRNWDPFWNRDKVLLLRRETLSCICCDPLKGPMNRCTNFGEPMACMKTWSVDEAERQCLEWMGKSRVPGG